MEVSDEALCRRVGERDEAAFDLLVGRYQGRAYRLAWSLVRNAEDARDLSQEAFLRVYQRAATFRGDARFSTWFYRILVNLCLDHRRRGRWWQRLVRHDDAGGEPEGSLAEAQPAPGLDPADVVGDLQMTARLWDAVAGLSPRQRAAIVLHVQEGLATSEIAAVMECTETTVRVHLHRAIAALRRTLRSA